MTPVPGGRTDTVHLVRTAGGVRFSLRMLDDRWGATGMRHVEAEAQGWRLLAAADLPVPARVAIDPSGAEAGGHASLSSWLPGAVRLERLDPAGLIELARVASVIHAVPVPAGDRPPPPARWVPDPPRVPGWTDRPALWRAALDLWAGDAPSTPPTLIHRDFHAGNLLWLGDRVSGVIDWTETSWGPPEVDVVHARTNLAVLHDVDQAEVFTAAYRAHGGRLDPDPEAQRYWAVQDVLGFLPDPVPILDRLTRSRPDLTPSVVRVRLEDVLARSLGA